MQKRLLDQVLCLTSDEKLELLERLETEITETLAEALDVSLAPLHSIADYEQAVREDLANPNAQDGILSGYPTVDNLCRGFSPGELIIFSGATGHGKTLLAQNILHNLGIQGIPSLFFSLEMTQKEISKRYLTMHQSSNLDNPWDVFRCPLYYYGGESELNLKLIRQAIGSAVKDYGVQIVLIDHLHYFARSILHVREEIDLLTRSIKLIARDFGVPIILIAHTRKLATDATEPQEVDLKDSSGIAQDADQVVMIWRDKTSANPADRRLLKLSVTKNRLKGITGRGELRIDANWKLQEIERRSVFETARSVFRS